VTVLPDLDQLQGEVPPGSPLERLTVASELADRLHARGDELLDQFVDAARTGGASWSQIGCSLGTSKQAAQQRFGALADPAAGQAPFGLTGPGADAMGAAAAEAQSLGHHSIRPEHLVLGLLARPEERAGQVLATLGVTPEAARKRVSERLGVGAPRPTGSLAIAPQTKRLLERARAISLSLGSRCPRTEHILLAGTAPKQPSSAATLLAECGAPPERVRDQLTRALLADAPELAERFRNRSRLRMRRL
jgi:hypothetical protein